MMTALKNKPASDTPAKWSLRWQEALNLWSPFVRLKNPLFCVDAEAEKYEGLSGSFAMIRLNDLAVVISSGEIDRLGLADYPLEILAHEIGHHVYCPADLADAARLNARIRRGLPTREHMAGMVGNLYSDLLINDRLFREHSLKMHEVYIKASLKTEDPLWNFYMRIYEILWSLTRGTLTTGTVTDEMEADAGLGARLIRSYSRDWPNGAGRFAALCLTYLLGAPDETGARNLSPWLDAETPGSGTEIPSGLAEIGEDEISGAVHPALEGDAAGKKSKGGSSGGSSGSGNFREPFEYGEIFRSLGINADPADITAKYYKERALPYVVPFPVRESPAAADPFPEGTDVWDAGSPIDDIDWMESASRSPVIIPGVTALKREYGSDTGFEKSREPVNLDIYVDCSGSMPDPSVNTSYPCLAGAIICLSALRAGSLVQATLWSGPNEFITTDGFISSEKKIFNILTGYLGGSTAFPLHILRNTYPGGKPSGRKTHILIISDEGVDTIFDKDEFNTKGIEIVKKAIAESGGGATMALSLWSDIDKYKELVKARKLGFDIHRVNDWSGLIEFSRSFSRANYGSGR